MVCRNSSHVRRSGARNGVGTTTLVVGSLVRGGDFCGRIQAMESKVFGPPRMGMDRLSFAVAVQGRLHRPLVFWLDTKYHGWIGTVSGVERNVGQNRPPVPIP